jgi:prophage regulatory protein
MGEVLSAGDLIPLEEVQAKTKLGASTIYKWMAADKFPLRVQLSPRCVRWLRGEVDAWIEEAAQGSVCSFVAPRPCLKPPRGPIKRRLSSRGEAEAGRGRCWMLLVPDRVLSQVYGKMTFTPHQENQA